MWSRSLYFFTFLLASTAAHADTQTALISCLNFTCASFNKFDTSLGTLTSYTLNIQALAYSTTSLDLIYKSALGTPILEVAPAQLSSTGYYNLSGSGTINSAADLAAISSSTFPTPRYQFEIEDLDSPTGVGYINTGGTVTFNYTPAASAPEIDSSLAASALILLAGAIAVLRERRPPA